MRARPDNLPAIPLPGFRPFSRCNVFPVNEMSKADVAAAAAVHRELGREYDDAIAEGLVERIGSEIDRRVDARLQQEKRDRHAAARSDSATRTAVFFGLGSMGIGIGAASVILTLGTHLTANAQIALVALIWLMIAVVNVAYSRRG
jgi:hypothetical protein